jgi:hypothetical protein
MICPRDGTYVGLDAVSHIVERIIENTRSILTSCLFTYCESDEPQHPACSLMDLPKEEVAALTIVDEMT